MDRKPVVAGELRCKADHLISTPCRWCFEFSPKPLSYYAHPESLACRASAHRRDGYVAEFLSFPNPGTLHLMHTEKLLHLFPEEQQAAMRRHMLQVELRQR